MQSLQQEYVFNQSGGVVTEPVNGNWLQAYCEFLGITEPLNSSWLQALCNHFGITEPLYSSWTIALANYYGITAPVNGTWWYALSQLPEPAPAIPFIWNEDTNNWEAEDRIWEIGQPVVPTADFTSDAVTVVEGATVQFTDTSLGGPTSWSWTFTGGTPSTSTDRNPSVVYNTVGQFQVSLEVSNSEGSDTKTVPNYMTVNVVPVVADFSADTTTPSEGDTVNFTDTSTGTPTAWSWTLPGATPSVSADQNPSVVYNTTGTYSVTLEASKTGSSDTEVKTDYIQVFEPATVSPITEFDTGLFYTTVSNPISTEPFATSLFAQNITQTT